MGGKRGKSSWGNLGTALLPFWRTGRRVGDVSVDEPVSEVSIVSGVARQKQEYKTYVALVCCQEGGIQEREREEEGGLTRIYYRVGVKVECS